MNSWAFHLVPRDGTMLIQRLKLRKMKYTFAIPCIWKFCSDDIFSYLAVPLALNFLLVGFSFDLHFLMSFTLKTVLNSCFWWRNLAIKNLLLLFQFDVPRFYMVWFWCSSIWDSHLTLRCWHNLQLRVGFNKSNALHFNNNYWSIGTVDDVS